MTRSFGCPTSSVCAALTRDEPQRPTRFLTASTAPRRSGWIRPSKEWSSQVNPGAFSDWTGAVRDAHASRLRVIGASLLVFPALALGLPRSRPGWSSCPWSRATSLTPPSNPRAYGFGSRAGRGCWWRRRCALVSEHDSSAAFVAAQRPGAAWPRLDWSASSEMASTTSSSRAAARFTAPRDH